MLKALVVLQFEGVFHAQDESEIVYILNIISNIVISVSLN